MNPVFTGHDVVSRPVRSGELYPVVGMIPLKAPCVNRVLSYFPLEMKENMECRRTTKSH